MIVASDEYYLVCDCDWDCDVSFAYKFFIEILFKSIWLTS